MLLEQHQVLTSDQLSRVYFSALRTCQLRLEVLRSLDLVARFRFARPYGGTEPWKWVLGLAGARFQAAIADRASPTERAHREQVLRLSASPTLDHLLTTNEFFVRLHHAARASAEPASGVIHAGSQASIKSAVGPVTSLDRWWSERTARTRFPGVQPDGHGLWTSGETTTGFFLECDLGTEALTRVVAKLPGYARLAANGGPAYPVLFWLPSSRRESNLQNLLRADPPSAPVATAVHDADPAAGVWLTVEGGERLRLEDLPSSHGPDSASNPNWCDGQLDLTNQHDHRRP